MTDNLLEQGVAALKEGRKEDARRLLAQALEQDEQNEMAWLWMSGVVDTDAERRVCLENVLAINPSNGIAKRGLESLGASQMTSPFTTVRPLAPRTGKTTVSGEQSIQPLPEADEPDTPEETERQESTEEEEHDQPPPRQATRRRGVIIGLGVGLLGILCVATVGIWWMFTSGPLSFQPVPTLVPTMDIGQTSTPTVADATPTSDTAPLSAEPTTSAPPTLIPTRTPRPTQTPLLTWTPSLTPTATMTTTATATRTPAMTLPPTWTPHPTSTPAAGMTLPPTWTPHPTNTPAPGITSPPTWTPASTITLPPTWTPAYSTGTPTVTPTLTLTSTAVITATPGG